MAGAIEQGFHRAGDVPIERWGSEDDGVGRIDGVQYGIRVIALGLRAARQAILMPCTWADRVVCDPQLAALRSSVGELGEDDIDDVLGVAVRPGTADHRDDAGRRGLLFVAHEPPSVVQMFMRAEERP
jgi:hypothetical protein